MKYIYIFLVILVFCCGTDQGKGDVYYYSIKNNSGRAIKIESYRSEFPDSPPKITNLAIDEIIEKKFKDGLPPSEYNFKNFLDGNGLNDSLVIIYENERIAIFKQQCNENSRNPIDICIYGDLTEDFVFTEEDYNNATECDGSCD